jgi:chromate reductase
MSATLDVVVLCGSLRKQSLNRMLAQAAIESMTEAMSAEVVHWETLPPFNADLMAVGLPPSVTALRDRIGRADAVLIVTPEYNYALPGMFKNTLDWLSRCNPLPLARKPVALLSATTGPLGGARVQSELRRVLLCLDALVLQKPEIYVGNAQNKFDSEGRCVDEATRHYLRAQMQAFVSWTKSVSVLDQYLLSKSLSPDTR